MFRKLAVALVATTMLAGPVLAQGSNQAAPAAAQTQKAPAIVPAPKAAATTVGQSNAAPAVKATTIAKRQVTHVRKHKRHVARVKHRRHSLRSAGNGFMQVPSAQAAKAMAAAPAKHFKKHVRTSKHIVKASKKVRVSSLSHRIAAKSQVR